MNSIVTTPINGDVSAALQGALEAIEKLEEARCQIVHVSASSRRVTLLVAAPPPFVKGVCKSRFPNPAGGCTRVMATRYFGVQLEWFVKAPRAGKAVAHG